MWTNTSSSFKSFLVFSSFIFPISQLLSPFPFVFPSFLKSFPVTVVSPCKVIVNLVLACNENSTFFVYLHCDFYPEITKGRILSDQ